MLTFQLTSIIVFSSGIAMMYFRYYGQPFLAFLCTFGVDYGVFLTTKLPHSPISYNFSIIYSILLTGTASIYLMYKEFDKVLDVIASKLACINFSQNICHEKF